MNITKWNQVIIGQFSKIQAAIALEKDPIEQNLAILAILKDVSADEIDKLTLSELTKELKAISFVKLCHRKN